MHCITPRLCTLLSALDRLCWKVYECKLHSLYLQLFSSYHHNSCQVAAIETGNCVLRKGLLRNTLLVESQAANKVVEIRGSCATQNELVAQWEAVSGRHVKTTTISGEYLAQHSAGASASARYARTCCCCPKPYCLPKSLDVYKMTLHCAESLWQPKCVS